MKTTGEYLDAVKAHLDLPSDYATAKALGVTPSAVSKYRLGRSQPDDLVCARIAEILDIEPMEVIAATHFERSTEPRAKALWEGIWGKAAGAIALNLIVCAVGVSVAPTSKAAASGENQAQSATLYIMSNRRRFRRETQLLGLKLAA
jgi:transcriptional regulator with XRE-family HTH domain